MSMELRPYQKKALEAIDAAYRRGVTRQLVVMATGLGKTICVAAAVAGARNLRTFGLMHREELIDQALQKISAMNPGVSIGVEKAGREADPYHNKIILASVQTVGRKGSSRLAKIPKNWAQAFWVDEVHHAPAASYMNVFEHFRLLGSEPDRSILTIGTTATPDRLDRLGYDDLFDDVVFRYDIADGIRDNWLADIRAYRVRTNTDISRVQVNAGEYVLGQLSAACNTPERNSLCIQMWKERSSGLKNIVFAVDKVHARDVAYLFEKAGAKVDLVLDDTPAVKRKEIVERFRAGAINVLVNVSVFVEGFDIEDVGAVHILRPTKSRAFYTQMVGRGTRRCAGKDWVFLFDYSDEGHDICMINSIFGLPRQWNLNGQSVLQDADVIRKVESDWGLNVANFKDFAEIDLAIDSEKFNAVYRSFAEPPVPSDLQWIKPIPSQDRYILHWSNETEDKLTSLSERYRDIVGDICDQENLWGVDETVEIFMNELGHYEARLTQHVREERCRETFKLDSDLSLARLIARTERWVKKSRPHKIVLLDRKALWKKEPATEKQINVLVKRGIPQWKLSAMKINKGQAQTLISMPSWQTKRIFSDDRPVSDVTSTKTDVGSPAYEMLIRIGVFEAVAIELSVQHSSERVEEVVTWAVEKGVNPPAFAVRALREDWDVS